MTVNIYSLPNENPRRVSLLLAAVVLRMPAGKNLERQCTAALHTHATWHSEQMIIFQGSESHVLRGQYTKT